MLILIFGQILPLVTHQPQITLGLPFKQMVLCSQFPETILSPQQQMLQHRASKQSNTKISNHHGVARDESWSIFVSINVGDHHPLEVCPSHSHTDRDTALIDTFGVVRQPCQTVWNARVYSAGCQECCCVLRPCRSITDQNGETDNSKGGDQDCAQSTLPCLVCDESDCHGKKSRCCVGWYRHELCCCFLVAELGKNWHY